MRLHLAVSAGAEGAWLGWHKTRTVGATLVVALHNLAKLAGLTPSHGYRVYFKQQGRELILLLVGGDKSTQAKDIKVALRLARNLSE